MPLATSAPHQLPLATSAPSQLEATSSSGPHFGATCHGLKELQEGAQEESLNSKWWLATLFHKSSIKAYKSSNSPCNPPHFRDFQILKICKAPIKGFGTPHCKKNGWIKFLAWIILSMWLSLCLCGLVFLLFHAHSSSSLLPSPTPKDSFLPLQSQVSLQHAMVNQEDQHKETNLFHFKHSTMAPRRIPINASSTSLSFLHFMFC